MTTKKGLGETVLGWFVVREGSEEEGAPLPDEIPEEEAPVPAPIAKPRAPGPPTRDVSPAAPRPAPPSPQAAQHAAPPARAVQLKGEVPAMIAGAVPDARVFAQVYRAAEITDAEQEQVEKALSLVQSLPTETPRELKKQIVEASMKAFGIQIDKIIEAGVQEIQALDAYIQHGDAHTKDVIAGAVAQVEKLEASIAEIRKLMTLQQNTQEGLTRASNEQKLRVQAVLEFFGADAVARVIADSPKLVKLK